jgi:hypothetical protein
MFDNAEALARLAHRLCACRACTGMLTEEQRSPGGWGFCRVCRCAWKVSNIDGRAYAIAIHSPQHSAPARDSS